MSEADVKIEIVEGIHDDTIRSERVENRDGTPRKKNVDLLLEQLREPQEEKRDTLRDGSMLIQAAILDKKDQLDGGETREIAMLRDVDAAVMKISYYDAASLDPETMELVAKFFRNERDQWDDPNDGTPKSTANKNKEIYNRILAEIYTRLPLPEVALGEAPEHEFKDVEAIMKPLEKSGKDSEQFTLDTVLESYQAIKEDITKTVEESQQVKIINKGREYAKANKDAVKEGKMVGILSENDTVEYRPYSEEETYEPKTPDDKRQFVLDIHGSYSHRTDAFEQLKEYAGYAVKGIEQLRDGKKLTDEQVDGIALLLAKLETDAATADNIHYARIIDDLGKFLKTKLYEAGEIELDEGEDDLGMSTNYTLAA